MGYGEAGSALAADSGFCERNSSLIKGLCEWGGVGAGRERRGEVSRYKFRLCHLSS